MHKTAAFLVAFLFAAALRASDLGFIAMGDTGIGTPDQYKVGAALKEFCDSNDCKFVTLLGDNIYPVGVKSVTDPQWESKFEKPYASLSMPFFVALGNHDYGGNVQAQIDYSDHSEKWKCPATYYYFRRGNADFFVIDTNRFDGAQQSWLKAKLAASDAQWKIVYGHHPIYSYGMHGDTASLRRDLLPLLKGNADLYLAGHDHDKQVLESETEPDLGFVISGAGAQLRPVKKGKRTLYAASTLGWTHFVVGERSIELKMIAVDGSVEYRKTYSKTNNARR